jgi:GR25 family glycosyltransferase involved in LPS biosynthesis
MDLNTFFNNIPIFIINLADSIDRRKHIEEQFGDYKNYEIFEAIDGRDPIKFREKYKVITPPHKFNLALEAILCTITKIIHTAYHRGYEHAIIFEDDINLELINKVNYTINDIINLNNDWELIQLYTASRNVLREIDDYDKHGIQLKRRYNNASSNCYLINRKGMEKFLSTVIIPNEDLTTFKIIPQFIDTEHVICNTLKTYLVNRPCIYYYFPTGSFESYYANGDTNDKNTSMKIVAEVRDYLYSLYK